MFKDLIYKENKVFSTSLKYSEPIEPLLSKIRQQEDLETAILLLEGKHSTNALFILENKLYAPCCLDGLKISPLLFSDFFKESAQCEAELTLYQVSPILFKCLLILSQYSPSVVGSPDVIDVERILRHIKKQKQEAVLVFKGNSQLQVFYFLKGDVRDLYFGGKKNISTSSDLQQQVLAAGTQAHIHRIELFDETDISAESDCEMAEKTVLKIQTTPPKKQEEDATNKAPYIQTPQPKNEDAPQPTEKEKASQVDKGKKNPKHKTDPKPLWVKVLSGSRAGFLIRFSPEPVSLGRGNVSVRLNDPQVSRFHAELDWGKDGLFIRDNHSTNGIFVNDEKVYRKTLALNDIIRLGDVRLKVLSGS